MWTEACVILGLTELQPVKQEASPFRGGEKSPFPLDPLIDLLSVYLDLGRRIHGEPDLAVRYFDDFDFYVIADDDGLFLAPS